MPDIYLYLSEAKIKQLAETSPQFIRGIAANLTFKLPLLEGSLSGKNDGRLISELQRVEKSIRREDVVPSFSEIVGHQPPRFFSFYGSAGRMIDHQVFWLAMHGRSTALLLVGSSGYVLGSPPSEGGGISPSADPIGALQTIFKENMPPDESLASRLSYIWQATYEKSEITEGTVPSVEGLALFVRSVPADEFQMDRVNCKDLKKVIIGTPLYVRQV